MVLWEETAVQTKFNLNCLILRVTLFYLEDKLRDKPFDKNLLWYIRELWLVV